jgi:Asp-tRNA(Asn)/Glu-tRNA(Gln) amidotransferase A subunit family amidase
VIEASARWLSAEDAMRQVRAGALDPQAVVEAHLDAIDRLDGRIHAFIHVDHGARSTSGVTLAVKDSQPVAGMPYTYGTSSRKDHVAGEDAVAVARARAAGMAVLGKTNLPELAASIGTDNVLFGPTHNPWRHGFTPGGSSGGSAAAVAAGMGSVALGDDMGGSIRIPASCCGVVGLRPTPNRVPSEERDATGLSSRGPFARTVADARLLFSVASGTEPAIPASRRRLVGVAWSEAAVPCADACRRAVAAIKDAGHDVEEIPWDAEPVTEGYAVVRRASVASFPAEPSTYGPGLQKLAAEGRQLSALDYFSGFTRATDAALGMVGAPLQTRYDFLLTPTLGLVPMSIEKVPAFLGEEWARYVRFVLPVSFARTPAISIPAGLHDGLPVGVQLVGKFAQEYELLAFAEELEKVPGLGFQRPPEVEG